MLSAESSGTAGGRVLSKQSIGSQRWQAIGNWVIAGGLPATLAVRTAAAGVYVGLRDGSLWVASPVGVVPVNRMAHSGGVLALAAKPDGGQIASLGAGPEVKLWRTLPVDDQATAQFTLKLPGRPGSAVAYSPDSSTLAVGAADGSVWLFNPQQGTAAGALAAEPAHANAPITALQYSADGQRLAAGHAWGQVTVWDLATGKPVLRGQATRANGNAASAAIKTLQFSPDGATLWLLDGNGLLQHLGQTPAALALAVLDCDGLLGGRTRARVDELNSLLDADATPEGRSSRPAVIGMSAALWRAWGHGIDPPGPGQLLVPADPAAQAHGQAWLAQLNKLSPVAPGANGVGLPGWQMRPVERGLQTPTVSASRTPTAQPIPPGPVADERLAGVPWPSQPADAQRQQAVRSALASVWQPQRDQRPQATAQIIAQAELLSDLLPLALTQAQGLADGKDPGSPDAQSRITQTLRLAQAASAVTL